MLRKIVQLLTFIGLVAGTAMGQSTVLPSVSDFTSNNAVTPLLNQAQANLTRGDFSAAISLLEQVLQQQGTHKAARKAVIQLLMRQARTKCEVEPCEVHQ